MNKEMKRSLAIGFIALIVFLTLALCSKKNPAQIYFDQRISSEFMLYDSIEPPQYKCHWFEGDATAKCVGPKNDVMYLILTPAKLEWLNKEVQMMRR